MQNGTLTNIFWGLLLIWFGFVAVLLRGDLGATVNSPIFAFGTGALLLLLNLARTFLRLRLSILTLGLGLILTIANAFELAFREAVPFLPELLIIAGAALIIGAFRTRNFQTY
ncbi:MAG: hypothetical protein JRM89_03785 [Nitrososphaerota archaeon]|nr:hypothetical protein [Nitrososphaerota archaeon]MDG6981687.1 hypothetical protein [Nitrososphaerota archaeon]MDG7015094.1 hypothetical protein [Nitrososphaerota archaeon]WGO49873.1 MAG: hypothetical protein JRM93_03250 [Nitrososphaerota archaeon]